MFRSKRVVAVAGLLASVVVAATPFGALAQVPTDPAAKLAALDAQRSGPGFNEHQSVVHNEVHTDVNVCSTAIPVGQAHCDARVRTDTVAQNARPAKPNQVHKDGTLGNSGAYDPSYLQSAYNLQSLISAGAGTGQTVAIVDAYDSPSTGSDLAYYRSFFGLPALPACTTWPSPTACFNKVGQSGTASPLPATNTGWAAEIALDLDMVSAACPNCSIILVEANSANYSDLATGVNAAVALGANVVSNSYGGSEWSGESLMDDAYDHPGIAMTVSSGDGGYGTEYPAASPYVTAVGGTSLNQATNTGTRNATESAWSGAGSGCSAYEAKPTWQKDTSCTNRTVADVSAVADPNTGVWIYDTTGDAGWAIYGGTSAASPIVGSVYALAGNSRTSGLTLSGDPYNNTSALFDVTSGNNGSCGTYLCTSGVGYDGPTGLGTPNGSNAFTNGTVTPPPPPAPPAPAADFSMSLASSSLTVYRGGSSVTDTLTLTAINGYHSPVTLSMSGAPAGLSVSASANPVTPTGTSRLSFHASFRTPRGTYTLSLKGTGSDGTVHSQTVSLTVN